MKRKIIIILCVLMVCIGIATRSGAGETYDLNGIIKICGKSNFLVVRLNGIKADIAY
ncbi:MAG: hypothetical protein KAQ72_14615 [Desulfobacula sp.]|nr:hypothetical protein [Desulfobacula sp.]